MKLLASLASPYTRKVRVVLVEKKIECDLELVDVAPIDNAVNAHNPLGKIPTLVLDDGTPLYDSRVISNSLTAPRPSAASSRMRSATGSRCAAGKRSPTAS